MVSQIHQLDIEIRKATTDHDYQSFARLAIAYQAQLGEQLCFQGFDQEVASLPGCYAAPAGCILLASTMQDGVTQDVGCVAIRPLNHDNPVSTSTGTHTCTCELKRMYVEPSQQGRGIGKALLVEILSVAKAIGYTTMVLDTLQRLKAANAIYEAFGFQQRTAYYHNPLPNVVYWETQIGSHCD
eukprot:jgi/Chrzof1/3266/Cz12g18130.t1